MTPSFLLVRHSCSRIVVLTVGFLCLTLNLAAQNPNGSLRGEVQDASAARVAGAQVVVQAVGSSFRREAVADSRGEFRMEGLMPGRYHMVATAKGFAQAEADVEVAVSVVRDLSI